MKRVTTALLVGLLAACAAPAAAAQEPRKVALVIGNGTYQDALPLKNSTNDANDVCDRLRKLDFEVICKIDIPNKRAFKDAIFEFTGKLNDKTVALFYFAGHGVQIDGLNYLLPVSAALRTKSDIEDESMQINYLMSEMDVRHAALNIFVLDACRNNPFVSPMRGYAPTLGLASQLYMPRNSIVAMSTGPGQLSLDGVGRNGTFTKALLSHVMTPRQPIEDMFKAVSAETSLEAKRLGRQQHPQVTTTYSEKFCMAGCSNRTGAEERGERVAAEELDGLRQTLAQTRAKQQELEEQKATLLKKQAELDQLKLSLGRERSTGQANADNVAATLSASATKLKELDAMKEALLKKQQELNAIQSALGAQQQNTDANGKEVRTRKIDNPAEPQKPITIVPAF